MDTSFQALSPLLMSPLTWFMAVLGLLVGSFLNVCIYRIPRKIFLSRARSHCPHCDAKIPAWHNIPVISWILLRGKAACCGKPISIQYPIVELVTALIFVLCYWQHPFLLQGNVSWQWEAAEFIRFAHAVIFCCLLLVCSVIDIHHQIIPDVISLPMVALTPVVVLLHPELTWTSALFGVLIGGGILYAVAWGYYLIRKEAGIGMGDVKLLAGIGGWLGYQAIIPTVFIASVTGAIFGLAAIAVSRNVNMRSAIPFGPFLALGAVIYLLSGQRVLEWLFANI